MRTSRVLHLSHVGPSKFPSGGRILIGANVEAERKLKMQSEWISIRTNHLPGERAGRSHFRGPFSGSYNDFGSIFWDHKSSYVLAKSDKARDFLRNKIDTTSHTVFVLDGPWLWPLLRLVLSSIRYKNYEVVYACHNVESNLLFRIASEEGADLEAADHWRFMLEQDEKELCDKSTLVTYLSEDDGSLLSKMTSTELIRTYVPGSTIIKSQNNFKIRKPLLDPSIKWFGFISGDWLPHNQGACRLIQECINDAADSDIGLVFVGSVSAGINRLGIHSLKRKIASSSNIRVLGQVTNQILNEVHSSLTGYVLPIEFGGGMGIKTIEAIQSKKIVFGTPSAFRGLEDFDHGTQLIKSDSSAGLWHELRIWNQNSQYRLADPLLFDNDYLVSPSARALSDLCQF